MLNGNDYSINSSVWLWRVINLVILLGKKSDAPEEFFFICDYYNYHANKVFNYLIIKVEK